MTGNEWNAYKEFMQFEVYKVTYTNAKEEEVLYSIGELDLHHLYGGGYIDQMVKAKKRDVEILTLFRNSMLNIIPMEHNAHIAKEGLIQYSYEDFIKIYDYFVKMGDSGKIGLRKLNHNNYDLTTEGKKLLLLFFVGEIFGETRSPFDQLEKKR